MTGANYDDRFVTTKCQCRVAGCLCRTDPYTAYGTVADLGHILCWSCDIGEHFACTCQRCSRSECERTAKPNTICAYCKREHNVPRSFEDNH
jgi:hypothetical protein